MRRWLGMFVAAGALVAAGCGGSTPAAPPWTSGQVVGVTFNGPAVTGSVDIDQQMALAVRSGVQGLRVSVDWAAMQPYPSFAEVPAAQRAQFVDVAGVPTRFAQLDRIVGSAANHGLWLLPVIENTPSWDGRPPGAASPPVSLRPFAGFLTALVHRYGPGGTYWSTHAAGRSIPIRMWQIWNEPHFAGHWSKQPFASSYVRLLSAAHAAIKSADSGAQVVLAGLADFSWQYLEQIYRIPGAVRLFDVVAIYPYTAQPRGVIVILQRARGVMDRFGDSAKLILATEVTWPSSQGKAPPEFGVSTTEAQQAQRLARVLPLLQANRARLRLLGFYWYTWLGDEEPATAPNAFDYAGLLKYVRGTVGAKPALGVFTRGAMAIEGCQASTDPCAAPPRTRSAAK